MKEDYKKIPGHASYGEDGRLLEVLIGDNNGTITIVEVGTYYGRHAVLWHHVLENKKCSAKHILIDAGDYAGSEVAQVYAEQRLNELQINKSIKKVDTLQAAAKQFEDCSVDIVYIDAGVTTNDVSGIIKSWANKVVTGGKLIYHDYATRQHKENFVKVATMLQQDGYELDATDNLVICTKLATKEKKAKAETSVKHSHAQHGV